MGFLAFLTSYHKIPLMVIRENLLVVRKFYGANMEKVS